MSKRDELEALLLDYGVEQTTIDAALNEGDRQAFERLFEIIRPTEAYDDIGMNYFHIIVDCAESAGTFVELAELLHSHDHWIASVLYCLRNHTSNPQVVSFLREQIQSTKSDYYRKAAAESIFFGLYNKSSQALDDETELVRVVALNYFRELQNQSIVIQAIQNDNARVRALASWDMGLLKVNDSVSSLHEQLKIETDIEALRAIVWSLGMLGYDEARGDIEVYQAHQDKSVRDAVAQALRKLN